MPRLRREQGRDRYRAYDERAEHLVWALSTIVLSLLAARFGLQLLGLAGLPGGSLLIRVTDLLLVPFQALKRGLLADQNEPPFNFEPAVLLAMMLYGIAGWAAALAVATLSNRRPPA